MTVNQTCWNSIIPCVVVQCLCRCRNQLADCPSPWPVYSAVWPGPGLGWYHWLGASQSQRSVETRDIINRDSYQTHTYTDPQVVSCGRWPVYWAQSLSNIEQSVIQSARRWVEFNLWKYYKQCLYILLVRVCVRSLGRLLLRSSDISAGIMSMNTIIFLIVSILVIFNSRGKDMNITFMRLTFLDNLE